jgi:DNA primase
MNRISAESIERVRAATDIVEVIQGHTELRRQGGRFTGLCPFHDERTPSFSVDPIEKLYYCFGCQVGGDVFTFLQEKEGLEFRDAVEQLADRSGVELGLETPDPRDAERRRDRDRLYELLKKAGDFYSRYLWESGEAAKARAYLESRGLGQKALEEYGVGYAPSAWDRVLTSALRSGFSERELQAAGLAQRGRQGGVYDRFRARIMFPLRDARGRVLGFGARAMREAQLPKYVNTSETPIYRKGRSLFGLDLARAHATREGRVIVVEGYTDVIALHQGGLENVVASMGTALTDEQVAELARLARVVLLAFDADQSGQEAMLRVQRAAAGRGIDLKVVRLPDDKDPCDLLLEEGPDSFATKVGEAISFLQFQVESVMEGADVSSAAAKDRLVAGLRPVFAGVGPSAERDEQVRRVADRLQLSEHHLTPLLAHRTAVRRFERQAGRPGPAEAGAVARGERTERKFLAMCVSSGERGREYLARLSDEHLSSDVLRRVRDWVNKHFDSPTAGLSGEDEILARSVSEIVVRASSEPVSETGLEIGFLQLEQRRLEAEIKRAADEEDLERQWELSQERSRITATIAKLMAQTAPVGSEGA